MLKRYLNPAQESWELISKRPSLDVEQLNELIKDVFQSVEKDGDAALQRYTKMFEGREVATFCLKGIEDLAEQVSPELKTAIDRAAKNIHAFHSMQKQETKSIEIEPGIDCWQKTVGLERVGLYIPGGSAPLFSTVLMLAIPAEIAGVSSIALFTPANAAGAIHPAIAYAAKISGVSELYTLGGAQAIAAATIGTKQVAKVDKIFGPGNQYVTAAKRYAQTLGTAIDMPAGPSEVLVWADEAANPNFIAADLLSQAEHGGDSQCVLLCRSDSFAKKVDAALAQQLEKLPRKDTAAKALEHSFAVILSDEELQLDFVNKYAAEHLIIQRETAMQDAERIKNAGSVFIGAYSPESVGDYASGTNHTLPTSGFAKAYSGVNLSSFSKQITFQKLSKSGLESLASTVVCMAENEGLQAHAEAVKIRL